MDLPRGFFLGSAQASEHCVSRPMRWLLGRINAVLRVGTSQSLLLSRASPASAMTSELWRSLEPRNNVATGMACAFDTTPKAGTLGTTSAGGARHRCRAPHVFSSFLVQGVSHEGFFSDVEG